MRKRVFGRKFSRGRGARNALFRSLIRSLIAQGRITTTKAKAKAIQGDVDRLITTAKQGTLAARRQTVAKLGNDKVTANKLFTEVVPSVTGRVSGYTRIVQLPVRRGDAAEMVTLEFVDKIEKVEKKTEKAKEKKKASSQASDKPQVKSKKAKSK